MTCRRRKAIVLAVAASIGGVAASPHAMAQQATAEVTLNPLTVTATRNAARVFDVPASVDVIDASALHEGQPQVNLSETLVRVPGVFAANRQNYAQDLQISSRGFGARAQFGVRGVRLYQDGIPVTMPDGQGQTGSFSLFSAQRIEVLRGPFSTLYGNASGGVISVFTEDPSPTPIVSASAGDGSYHTWTLATKGSGTAGGVGYVAAASEFKTNGYRDHSQAERQLTNAKLVFDTDERTRVTVIGNTQYQPETQDPLGLSRAQWEANPRGADPSALTFDTRKTINQTQGGVAVDHGFGNDLSLHVATYAGRRLVRQYLALSGVALTSSGGVTDLDRDFEGIGARLTWRTELGSRPLTLTVGADTDRQRELRKGFVNNNGSLGDLRRDEDDIVRSTDAYAEAQWAFHPAFSATAGVRTSRVRYTSADHFINTQNPDDSGAQSFSNTSPVLGLVWHAADTLNAYASYGEGFETPTFAELAYRPGGTGLNFDLKPATSRAVEVGIKALMGERQRLNVAVFHVDTSNEIIVDAATGGRTTYKNAGDTRRDGAEAAWDAQLPFDVRAHLALTYLRARFVDDFTTGSPPQPVASGARLPGVPSGEAYGELAYAPHGRDGFQAAIEAQYTDKLYVNERNVDAAPAYTIANARVSYTQRLGRATVEGFARLNNMFDRRYVGSVIVGDTNGRFFEPAPERNWFVGLNIDVAL
ncbi:MAG TPA: TonB-dependent receptor [Casimicrobiaceae bacterium]|nr:TonB-dependent receptor [Casimicrobiaceae bacterium]